MNLAMRLGLGPQHTIEINPDGSAIVTVVPPPIAGSPVSKVPLTAKQYEGYLLWRMGNVSIQKAMPDVPAEVREIFQSGITPDVWDAMFAKED